MVNLKEIIRKTIPVMSLLFVINGIVVSQQPSFRYNVEYKCGNERVVVRYCRNDGGQQVPESQNFCQVEFPDRPRRVAEIAVFAVTLKSEIGARLQACAAPDVSGATSGGSTTSNTVAANEALSRGLALMKSKDYSGAMVEFKEVLRLEPRHANAFYQVGVAQYNLKDYTVANAAFERAVQLNVANPHVVYTWIGDCQRALGQNEKAFSAYREAVRIKPDYAEGFNKMGLAYFALKDYSNAVIFFDQAARLDPKTTIYRKNAGTAYVGGGKKDEAMKVYNALVPVDPKLAGDLLDEITKGLTTTAASKPRTPAETNFDIGTKFYTAKDYPKALASFQVAMRLQPDYGEASHHLGMTHYQLKEYPQAIAAFENALKLKYEYSYFSHEWIGDAYYAQKQYEKAIAAYKETVRLKPDHAQAFVRLGNSNYSLKQYPDALAAYQAAIKLKPDDAVCHASMGDTYSQLKRYDKAILSYGEAVRVNPKYDYALNMMGVSHYVLKQYAAALPAYEQVVKLKPDNALYLMNLGDTYFMLGRKADALAVHKKLLTLDKAKADELFTRINTTSAETEANATANTAIRKGQDLVKATEYAKAIAEFQKAIAAKPTNTWLATAHYSIGDAYTYLRDWPQATSNLLTAARLDPTYSAVHDALGYVYMRTLQFPKAVAAYQEAIRLGETDKLTNVNTTQLSLGKVYALMGRRTDAMQIYTKLQTADPEKAKTLLSNIEEADKNGPAGVLVNDAFDMELSGESEEAVDIYQSALKLKPSPKVLLDIADGLGSSGGKFAESIAIYRQVLTLKASPDDLAEAHYKIGQYLNTTKEYAKAIPEIREAQRIKADYNFSHELGDSYTGLKRFPEALAAYQEAENLKPKYPWQASTIKTRISETYVAMGQTDKAIAYLEGATKVVEKTAPVVCLELAKLYIAARRFADAVTLLSKTVQATPDYKDGHFQLGLAYVALGQKAEAMKTYRVLRPLDGERAQKLLAEINKP